MSVVEPHCQTPGVDWRHGHSVRSADEHRRCTPRRLPGRPRSRPRHPVLEAADRRRCRLVRSTLARHLPGVRRSGHGGPEARRDHLVRRARRGRLASQRRSGVGGAIVPRRRAGGDQAQGPQPAQALRHGARLTRPAIRPRHGAARPHRHHARSHGVRPGRRAATGPYRASDGPRAGREAVHLVRPPPRALRARPAGPSGHGRDARAARGSRPRLPGHGVRAGGARSLGVPRGPASGAGVRGRPGLHCLDRPRRAPAH